MTSILGGGGWIVGAAKNLPDSIKKYIFAALIVEPQPPPSLPPSLIQEHLFAALTIGELYILYSD